MMCDKVTESIVSCEGEVIGSRDSEANCFVKEDDTTMLGQVNKGGELTNN